MAEDTAVESSPEATRRRPSLPPRCVVDAPATDVTNEPREARRGGRERNPNQTRGSRGLREEPVPRARCHHQPRLEGRQGWSSLQLHRSGVVGDGNGWSASATARRARFRPPSRRASRKRRRTSSASRASATTIPHPVQGEAAAGVVLLRPAAAGTGVIAGGPVRAVLECAGIHDVLSKSLGSSNTINIVHATVAALKQLEEPRAVAARRGLDFEDVAPARLVRAEADAGGARDSKGRCLMAARLKITQIKSKISEKQNHARHPAEPRASPHR